MTHVVAKQLPCVSKQTTASSLQRVPCNRLDKSIHGRENAIQSYGVPEIGPISYVEHTTLSFQIQSNHVSTRCYERNAKLLPVDANGSALRVGGFGEGVMGIGSRCIRLSRCPR